MKFIHAREYLNTNQFVRVNCDTQSNIMITDDYNFSLFKRGKTCRYRGGFYKRFPVELYPSTAGYWNVTIDVGQGYRANIRYSITVITLPGTASDALQANPIVELPDLPNSSDPTSEQDLPSQPID